MVPEVLATPIVPLPRLFTRMRRSWHGTKVS